MGDVNKDIILSLYHKPETVFTVNEISQLFPAMSDKSLRNRLYYFTKVGKLKKVHHGIYAKSEYNPLELVNKIYKPSYISLETVLVQGGVMFQHYETTFLVSYLTRTITINDTSIQYRQIKGDILTNPWGIEQKTGYFIASLERAFLDAIYIYKNYHFDNLGVLNWDLIGNLKKIYKSKIFERRVETYYRLHRDEYGKH